MKIRALLYLFALSLIACNSKPEAVNNPMDTKWNPDVKLTNAPSNNFPVQSMSSSSASSGPSSGTNPPHGQPGHRCDVAVGAPLNGGANVQQTTNTPPQITSTNPTGIATQQLSGAKVEATTAKGLNPEHGKSGHRCDIAVGAPLSSKPAQSTAAVQTASSNPVATAKGTNPPHGQPGHRCDIAVGAPLNSKSAQATAAPAKAAVTTDTAKAQQPSNGQK